MKPISRIAEYLALAALPGVLVLNPLVARADDNTPPATASRPAKAPTEQTSVPNNSPPASATRTTGQTSQDPTIQKMNDDERRKVETKGK
jgi:hypothetical protein